ncbi:MAG: hypothetical protein NWQ54_04665, partial [Paraglaciecola sp.]|nr:hypothetical protein [Paraglaciecola sp.]
YAVKLRIEAIDRVMQLYSLGKYGVKSDDIDVVAQDAINEYKAYCKKPEKIDVVNLTRLFQMLGCYVDEPSEDLKKHLMLMKIISICDLKVRSYYIPKRIIELGFISDLAIFSLVDYNTWLNSIKSLIKTGIAVKEVEKCLDLAVLIEDFNGRKIINFAPAIYNVTNLLMSELPNSPTINSFRSEFTDLSLVSAAVFGNVRSIEKYKAWVFSKTS